MQKHLIVITALVAALLSAQIPEVIQQYRQRLGGAVDELSVVVGNYDDDTRRSGYDRKSGLDALKENPDRLVRKQSERMSDYIKRLDRLKAQQAALMYGLTFSAIFAVIADYDTQTMSRTWASYVPSFPTTSIGILFALVGFLACSASLFGVSNLASRRPA